MGLRIGNPMPVPAPAPAAPQEPKQDDVFEELDIQLPEAFKKKLNDAHVWQLVNVLSRTSFQSLEGKATYLLMIIGTAMIAYSMSAPDAGTATRFSNLGTTLVTIGGSLGTIVQTVKKLFISRILK